MAYGAFCELSAFLLAAYGAFLCAERKGAFTCAERKGAFPCAERKGACCGARAVCSFRNTPFQSSVVFFRFRHMSFKVPLP